MPPSKLSSVSRFRLPITLAYISCRSLLPITLGRQPCGFDKAAPIRQSADMTMIDRPPLVLASKSPFRAALMSAVGLTFETRDAGLDERAVEEALGDTAEPADRAEFLAEAKALAVSEAMPDCVVIGCDQILALGQDVLHKVTNMEAARRRLLHLQGKTHSLHSGLALALNGEVLWSESFAAHMTMRALDPAFVGRHLALTGDRVLGSVGCYQIEGPGLNLFQRIDGDYWTIIGLPLLPLLAQLRARGIIDG
jgi:septum formation protein